MTTIYRGSILHSLTPDRFELRHDADLVTDEAGRIIEIRDRLYPTPRGVTLIDHSGRLIVPGLVDAHFHLPQIDVIGIASQNLIDWLRDHIFAAEAENEDPVVARDRAQRSFQGLLSSGTTAVAAYSSRHTEATHIAFEEAERLGIRAMIGKVLMDREAPQALIEDASVALEGTEKLVRRWHGAANGRLEVAVTPRFGITASEELLAGAGRLAQSHRVAIQTHLSENKEELQTIATLFPDRRDYTEVYEHAGLIGERSILAHCIHLSHDEIDRLATAGACAVYCPDSNFFLHSGRFPLEPILNRGLDVALGTDIGAGTSWSLLEAMKMGNYMQIAPVEPALLFYMGTLGGAKALGWERRIGNFSHGKEADLVVLEVEEILAGRGVQEWQPDELLSMLIHRGHRATVREVYIGGHRVQHS